MDIKEETKAQFRALAKAIDQAWLNTHKRDFAAAVHEYRQLEADFAARAPDDEYFLTEMRRRIAESILLAAHSHDPPFEVCRDAWNDLLRLGFSTVDTRSLMTAFYADCCLYNQEFDAGLDVLEPLIAELERSLAEPTCTEQAARFCHQGLASLKRRRDGLIALRTGGAVAAAWLERDEAEDAVREAQVHWMSRDGRDRELDIELGTAMKSIADASWTRSFAETTRDYRQVEAEFLPRLQGADEFFVPEARRRINSAILMDAHKHHQPFDVCRDVWNELLPLDFTNILQKCAMAWFYADCCRFNNQSDAGLAVVEPLMADLQQHLDKGTDTEMSPERYPEELERLGKLRDKLNALQK